MADTPEPRPHRLVFVCSGNICRSPMAVGFARALAPGRGLQVEVRSGGTLGIIGRPADPLAVKVMGEQGIDISDHRSGAMDDELVAWADRILVMELRHQVDLRGRFPDCEGKLMMLGNFGGLHELPDPIGGWRWRFRRSRDAIRRCTEGFLGLLG